MTRLDDPELVAREYADDARLRKRASAYTGVATGIDARETAMAAIRDLAPSRVLEVGCGWGELAEWIQRDTGAEVVAVDLSPRMVELARERGVDARVADVQELPFADGEFDLVVAAWMLYHVPDLDRGLTELARVLRPGGRLVILDMALPTQPQLRRAYEFYFRRVLPWVGRRISKHTTAYTWLPESTYAFPPPPELARRMTRRGFRDVSYTGFMGGVCALHLGTRE